MSGTPVKEQRVTKQRVAISAALDTLDDFVSTQELHRLLHEQGTRVSLATTYRILASMADEGELDTLRNTDGEAVYRRCSVTSHHHHLLCRECGKTVEIEAPEVESWAASQQHPALLTTTAAEGSSAGQQPDPLFYCPHHGGYALEDSVRTKRFKGYHQGCRFARPHMDSELLVADAQRGVCCLLPPCPAG